MKKRFFLGFLILLFILWSARLELTAFFTGGFSQVSNLAYNASSWDNVVGVAPSMNAMRDKIESMVNEVTVKTVATPYTIGTDDTNELYNGLIIVTAATTVTVPAVANYDGLNFALIVVGAYQAYLDVNAADRNILDGTALADGERAASPATTGAAIACAKDSSSGIICTSGSNNGTLWTNGG